MAFTACAWRMRWGWLAAKDIIDECLRGFERYFEDDIDFVMVTGEEGLLEF